MTTDASPGENPLNDVIGIELTPEDAWARFDAEVRETLGISANEFARRFDAGAYGDPDDDLKVMSMAFAYEGLRRNGFPR